MPYEVRAFRGSHLELMLELEGSTAASRRRRWSSTCRASTRRRCEQTPLLELYAAGVRYRKALDTLVTEAAAGQVRPEQIEAFTRSADMTLDGADAWLADLLDDARRRARRAAAGA